MTIYGKYSMRDYRDFKRVYKLIQDRLSNAAGHVSTYRMHYAPDSPVTEWLEKLQHQINECKTLLNEYHAGDLHDIYESESEKVAT